MNELVRYFVIGAQCFMIVAGFACTAGCVMAILYLIGGLVKGIAAQFKGGDDNEG